MDLLHQQMAPLASPNGEATPGSERRKNLMFLVNSALRIMASWAQMELDDRQALHSMSRDVVIISQQENGSQNILS